MTHPMLPPSLLVLLMAPANVDGADQRARVHYGQFSFHQRIVIRVPRIPDQPPPPPDASPGPVEWSEHKAPKCVAMTSIAGASFTRAESVDLIIVDGRRLRARFDDHCPAIDFYSGFYLKPTADGMVCAKRDSVRSRSGDACRIESFRQLVLRRR